MSGFFYMHGAFSGMLYGVYRVLIRFFEFIFIISHLNSELKDTLDS